MQVAIAETLTKKNELLEQANEQMQAAHKVNGRSMSFVVITICTTHGYT